MLKQAASKIMIAPTREYYAVTRVRVGGGVSDNHRRPLLGISWLFHNAEVRLGAGACHEYWFARFAWTVRLSGLAV